MTSTVETMARAYWEEWHQRWKRITDEDLPVWDDLPENARAATECCFIAALKAMREATAVMVKAAEDADLDIAWNYYHDDDRPGGPADVFTVMIDAAIAEAER